MKRLLVLARSVLAGGAATLVDLGAMGIMVSVLHIPPRAASVPALLLAGTVNFLGNRHFAFRAASSSPSAQAKRFFLVHLVTLSLNALLFDLVIRGGLAPYWLVRLVVSNAVYLTWSFPMFQRVFAVPTRA